MDELIKSYEDKIPGTILDKLRKELSVRKLSNNEVEKVLQELEKSFEESKIDSGESIGIITAESFGEPSTQMSIASTEKIIIKIRNKIKIIEIGKFVDSLMNLRGSMRFDDSEVIPLNEFDIYAPSLNQKEKIEWKRVMEASRHKTNKRLLKLTTKSGRAIVATGNHSFVTRKNNMVKPILGKDLTAGDRIPVMNYLPENCIDEIDLLGYLTIPEGTRFIVKEKDGLLVREKTLAKPIPQSLKLDRLFGLFIGAYLSEGNATNGQITISNLCDSFINNSKLFVKRLGLEYVENYHQRGFSLSRDLKINSSLFANFINTICGTGAKYKNVPEFSFSSNPEFVSGLLRGYFDGDGNFTVERKMIRVSTNSKELRDSIALLLSRFRIFSYKINDKKGQYWLLVPYKYAPLFLAHIGSDIPEKKRALEELAVLAKKFWNKHSSDYNDMISGFGDIFRKTAKKVGYPTRYINNFDRRQKIGRTTLFRYIKLFEKLSKEDNTSIGEELKIMKKMFYSDVIWDEIVDIRYVNNKGYVYDLSVPGLETFTTFDGILTHNTLNVFHFAGVAEMSVSLGLPRLIELFDARKTLKTPMMNVYINSPYNKDPLKVRKIAGKIKEIKLREVSREININVPKLQVEAELNMKNMKFLGLGERDVAKTIGEQLKGAEVRVGTDRVIIKSKNEQNQLLDLYQLKEKAKGTYISGVKGVKQVLPVKSGNEFMILTSGSNLKEVFKIKEVDYSRTTSNDIHEVKKVLGIEATRQTVINESIKVMEDQGLDVDLRHIMLIADLITNTGLVKGITRSGITGEKESVLARASFETPIKHIVNASLLGEEDYLNSVIENVMLNQPVPLGTGLPDLVVKMVGEGK